MSKFLKGNYEVSTKIDAPEQSEADAVEQEFYRRAHQRLGGSIAYIMKSKSLLWKGDKATAVKPRGGNGTTGS